MLHNKSLHSLHARNGMMAEICVVSKVMATWIFNAEKCGFSIKQAGHYLTTCCKDSKWGQNLKHLMIIKLLNLVGKKTVGVKQLVSLAKTGDFQPTSQIFPSPPFCHASNQHYSLHSTAIPQPALCKMHIRCNIYFLRYY